MGAGRTKWMNSPNVYQKVEILETGTPDPKKITKWVQDGSPSKSTAIPIESPNQFVPLGTSKKEFRKLQTAMKEVDEPEVSRPVPSPKCWKEMIGKHRCKTAKQLWIIQNTRSAQPRKASSREISNTTLPFSIQPMLETPLTMFQRMSWQNTDALLTLRIEDQATLQRTSLWPEVLIPHLKVIIRSMGKKQTETGPFPKVKGIPQRPQTQKWPLRARKSKRSQA